MASPQPDQDFMRLSRPLLEAAAAADLSRAELQVFLAILRLSYGFSRKDTAAAAGYTTLARMTRRHRSRIAEALKGLRAKGLVMVVRQGSGHQRQVSVYAPQKDYERWTCLPNGWQPAISGSGEHDRSQEPDPKGPENRTRTSRENRTRTSPETATPEKRGEKRREKRTTPQPPTGAVARIWSAYVEAQRSVNVIRRSPHPTKDIDPDLRARLREHSEDEVLRVILWAHNSSHERARRLREGSHLGQTLFRASKFAQYLAFADSEAEGLVPAPAASNGGSQHPYFSMSQVAYDRLLTKPGDDVEDTYPDRKSWPGHSVERTVTSCTPAPTAQQLLDPNLPWFGSLVEYCEKLIAANMEKYDLDNWARWRREVCGVGPAGVAVQDEELRRAIDRAQGDVERPWGSM